MINILLNRNDPNRIGDLEIEVTISEEHQYKNNVTNYKVEAGFDISDHVHQEPEKITMEGVFSETPIPNRAATFTSFIQGAGASNIQTALEALLAIAGYALPKQPKVTGIVERQIDPTNTLVTPERFTKPQIVDLVSGLRIYTNMICTSLTMSINRQTGQSLPFSMSFKKIYTVESKIVSIDKTSDLNGKAPNVKNQAPKTKNAGNQTVKQPSSTLVNLWDGAKGLFGR